MSYRIERLLRFILAGCIGAIIGWFLVEPWEDNFGHVRDFFLLYMVSLGIAFGMIIQKFFFAGTSLQEKLDWTKDVSKKWWLYVIPLVGVIAVKFMLHTPVQGKIFYAEHAGKHHISGALTDKFGNPEGAQYDLVKDGSFEGAVIAVLHLYTGEGFDFKLPEKALREKGFRVHRWTSVPTPEELAEVLKTSCQFWLISTNTKQLNENHLREIKDFFNSGRGIYIWGDNAPYYADANYVAEELFGVSMQGNTPGNQIVTLQKLDDSGFKSHLVTTGIEYLYEGNTIATIQKSPEIEPLIYGSGSNLVASIYDKNGKRAIIDGGFTRLFVKWDTAGTGRYVKNAAAWLVNYKGGSSGLPFWKRLLGWSLCGLLIGLTIGIGEKRSEMIIIGSVGGFLGGLLSAICFILIDLIDIASGSTIRFISFALLGMCIGFTIFVVEFIYSKIKPADTRFDIGKIKVR